MIILLFKLAVFTPEVTASLNAGGAAARRTPHKNLDALYAEVKKVAILASGIK